MGKLNTKTAIITGASSGMGKAMAELFAAEGANVVLADLHQNELEAVAASIRDSGGNAWPVVCNVALEEEIGSLVGEALRVYGSVDILVNNAGVMDDFLPVDKLSTERWDHVMNINIRGPFLLCRAVLPGMLERGNGVILNIASVGGLYGSRAGAVYTTSKHAMIGLTKNIGFMYAKKGIRCNAIAPGGVNTNIGKGMNPDPFGYERCTIGGGVMPRMGEASEIASTALFLVSEESGFVNGAIVTADGGWTAY